jgi:hypothetical protein
VKIPFSTEEFLTLFELYNNAVWPTQLVLHAMALALFFLILKGGKFVDKIVIITLAFFWIWMGVVYHIGFFSSINPLAYGFGLFFLIQGLLFLYAGLFQRKIEFNFAYSPTVIIALLLVLYALLIYPILGFYSGHAYPRSPTFGVPCPTTIFTFGVLLLTSNRLPWYLIAIPFLWSLIGFSAALHLSIYEDYGLVAAGILSTILLMQKPLVTGKSPAHMEAEMEKV